MAHPRRTSLLLPVAWTDAIMQAHLESALAHSKQEVRRRLGSVKCSGRGNPVWGTGKGGVVDGPLRLPSRVDELPYQEVFPAKSERNSAPDSAPSAMLV